MGAGPQGRETRERGHHTQTKTSGTAPDTKVYSKGSLQQSEKATTEW